MTPNLNPRKSSVLDACSPSLTVFVLLAGTVGVRGQPGQPVLSPPPSISVTPPALSDYQAAETGLPQSAEQWTALPLGNLFQWGPVKLHPHFYYSLSHADGLLARPGDPESTLINTFSPGILFVIGDHWTLDYTPSWQWYSNDKFQNTLSHNVALNGWTTYEDWIFGLSQAYRLFTAPVVQTGTQTEQESFDTALTAAYRFNSKVSADFSLNQYFQSAQNEFGQTYESYRQWSTLDWVNYQFLPRFNAGLGIGGGYVNVETGSDMTFEQFQGRINWVITGKSSFVLHGGLEYRQFLSGGASPLLNPVFGASFVTQLTPKTVLSLNADRVVSASYFVNETSESTSVSLSLGQKISTKLLLSVSGSYGHVDYTSSLPGLTPLGGYDFWTFNTRLSYPIISRGAVSAVYQFSKNDSTDQSLSFTLHQVSLELTYSF
jgi:hypothetical protein